MYIWFTALHNNLLLLKASSLIWLFGSSNHLFPEVLEHGTGCSCIELMCKIHPLNQSCRESAPMRVDAEPVMGTHHTQVFYPLCYCPAVAIRIHFKRLFPLLTGPKSLLSQCLTNSYLHLLNLEGLQLTDPGPDWWQGGVHHIYMLCLHFIQALCLFLPMLSKPEPADTQSLTQKHSNLNRLGRRKPRQETEDWRYLPSRQATAHIHAPWQVRNTIFGLLFFGYILWWCNTPQGLPDSKKLSRQCCSVSQKEVAAKSDTMM